MGTNGVGGTGDVKWTKALFDKLDVKDGKPADGKIEASIWNGFLESIGSKGNTIEHFITFERAEKSFEYYKNTKDKGDVDWSNPDALLEKYEQDVAAAADGEGGQVAEEGAHKPEPAVHGPPPNPLGETEELTEAQRAGQLAEVFGENKEVEAHIEAKATGIGNDFDGKIKLPDGAKLEEGKLPEVLFMSLPKAYGGKYMKLTLVDADKGVYTTTASNRKFQIEINDGKVTMKAYETEELEPKLKADQIKYDTKLTADDVADDELRAKAQANINASVDLLAEMAYSTDPKPEITEKKDPNSGEVTSKTIKFPDPDKRSIYVSYDTGGNITCVMITASEEGVTAHHSDVDIKVTDKTMFYDGDPTDFLYTGKLTINDNGFNLIMELVNKILNPAS